MIESKYLILILGILIIFYLYRSNKLNSKKQKNLIGGNIIQLINITESIGKNWSIKSEPKINESFNYNNFKLHFTLGRLTEFIIGMTGGILTIGSNRDNYHNLIIHLKKNELIISLLGYNTHLSFNLNELRNAIRISFKLEYTYPYLNMYVIGYTSDNQEIKGYINYKGELSMTRNTNFRLYLHPFKNTFFMFGTTTFIKNKNNLSHATSILSNKECYLKNIELYHSIRQTTELFSNMNINKTTINKRFKKTEEIILLSNINIINIELIDNTLDESCELFRFLENTNKSISLIKEKNEIFLRNDSGYNIIKFYLKKNISKIYIELIPFFKKHIFCIYIDSIFYKYVINISNSNIDNTNIRYSEIVINNIISDNIISNSINNLGKLVDKFSILKESLNSSNDLISNIKLLEEPEDIKHSNCSIIDFTYNTNVKLEYFKLLQKDYINYNLFIYNNFKKKYKLINNLQINKHNVDKFTDVYLNINDNTIGYKYRLELYSDIYSLLPLKINKNGNFENNLMNINNKGTDISWFFQKIKKNEGENKQNKQIITYIYDYNKYKINNTTSDTLYKQSKNTIDIEQGEEYIMEYLDTENFIIKIKNTNDTYYIYFENSSDIDNIRLKPLPLLSSDSKRNYTFTRKDYIKSELGDNIYCNLKRIDNTVASIEINSKISNLIELYGIENPYPKLYIYNNDITQSTKPCSYIYSTENSIIENMEAEITYISNKQDQLDNNIEINLTDPLYYWGNGLDYINIIMFSNNLLKFPAVIPKCFLWGGDDGGMLESVVVYYTNDETRDNESKYNFLGPSARPLDKTSVSEFIMKLSYDKENKYYNFEFSKSLMTDCDLISGNKIKTIVDDAYEESNEKYKLGQSDALRSENIYLEKVNGIYDYEFYIYTQVGNTRYYLDDNYEFENLVTVKETDDNPNYSTFTSWHIVPDILVQQEHMKIKQAKIKNKINTIKVLTIDDTDNTLFKFDRSDIVFDKQRYENLYLYNVTQSVSNDLDIFYKSYVKTTATTLNNNIITDAEGKIFSLDSVDSNVLIQISSNFKGYVCSKKDDIRVKNTNSITQSVYATVQKNTSSASRWKIHTDTVTGRFRIECIGGIEHFSGWLCAQNDRILDIRDIYSYYLSVDKDELKATYFEISDKRIKVYATPVGELASHDFFKKLTNNGVISDIKEVDNAVYLMYHTQPNSSSDVEIIKNNNFIPKPNDLLIYRYMDTSETDFRKYVQMDKSDILKYALQFKDKSNDTIRGNLFGVNGVAWEGNNLIYEYCSNNESFYNNKKYAYNYKNSDEKYYMADETVKNIAPDEKYYMKNEADKKYKNKKRITTRELSNAERVTKKLIEKLTMGVNIVGFKNGKNLNKNQPTNKGNIFKSDENYFKLEWENNSNSRNFKTGLLINIKTDVINKLNININEYIFHEYEFKNRISEIVNTWSKSLYSTPGEDGANLLFSNDIRRFPNRLKKNFTGILDSVHDFDMIYNTRIKKCRDNGDSIDIEYSKKCGDSALVNYTEIHPETYIEKYLNDKYVSEPTIVKSLTTLYMSKEVPQYTNLNIHKYNWKIEFDGIYNPDKTEFHLKSTSIHKYLIIDDNENLKWSKTKGVGWKFNENSSATPIVFDIEKYRKTIDTIVKNRINEIYTIKKKSQFDEIHKDTLDKFISKRNEHYKCIDNVRIDKIKKISKYGCHIFSPNLGKFLKCENSSFSWTYNHLNDPTTLFYISPTESNTYIKNNTDIQIASHTKDILNYATRGTGNKIKLSLGRPTTVPKWTIDVGGKLNLDSDRNNLRKPLTAHEQAIHDQFTLIKNNNASIIVGEKIFESETNIYEAIDRYWYHQDKCPFGFVWIEQHAPNHYKFYIDGWDGSTITNAWLIAYRDKKEAQKSEIRIKNIIDEKAKNQYIPPWWKSRRITYQKNLELLNNTNCTFGVPTSIYFKLKSNGMYLSSNNEIDFTFDKQPTWYNNQFYIIPRNEQDSGFIKDYIFKKSLKEPLYNFLHSVELTEPFIIYSNIKEYDATPSLLYLNYDNTSINLYQLVRDPKRIIDADPYANISSIIHNQLWQVKTRKQEDLELISTDNVERIEFEIDICNYKNKNITFANMNNNATIKVIYIKKHSIYSGYYIFMDTTNNKYLSIHIDKCINKKWDGKEVSCIGKLKGVHWSNESNIVNWEYILKLPKESNKYVFKIISHREDPSRLLREEKDNIPNYEILQENKTNWKKEFKKCGFIEDDIVRITSEFRKTVDDQIWIVGLDSNRKGFDGYMEDTSTISDDNFIIQNIMSIDAGKPNKYKFRVKNIIEDPTYTIHAKGYIEFICNLESVYDSRKVISKNINQADTSPYKSVRIWYIIDTNEYIIKNNNDAVLDFINIGEGGGEIIDIGTTNGMFDKSIKISNSDIIALNPIPWNTQDSSWTDLFKVSINNRRSNNVNISRGLYKNRKFITVEGWGQMLQLRAHYSSDKLLLRFTKDKFNDDFRIGYDKYNPTHMFKIKKVETNYPARGCGIYIDYTNIKYFLSYDHIAVRKLNCCSEVCYIRVLFVTNSENKDMDGAEGGVFFYEPESPAIVAHHGREITVLQVRTNEILQINLHTLQTNSDWDKGYVAGVINTRSSNKYKRPGGWGKIAGNGYSLGFRRNDILLFIPGKHHEHWGNILTTLGQGLAHDIIREEEAVFS